MAVIQAIRDKLNLDAPSPVGLAKWPPDAKTKTRFDQYEHYRAIWEGAHALALDEQDIAGRYGQYIAVNLPRILVTIPADFLFGEEFELEWEDDVADSAREACEEILERNDARTMFYESSLDGGVEGDVLIAVERNEEGEAVLRPLPVCNWYPETDPDNVRVIKAHWLAWKRVAVINNREREFLRLTKHEKGRILNFAVEVDKEGKLGPDSAEAWAALYPDGDRPEAVVETGLEDFAVEHIPAWRTAKDLYGRSEYLDVQGIIASINARVTQSDQVMAKHSDPMLGLPQDTFNAAMAQIPLTTNPKTRVQGYGRIDKANLDVVSMGSNGEKPEYVTWDGQLADNLAYIDKCVNLLCLVSETAPQLLNVGEWGGDLSGRALKILLLRTLAKVNRRRMYYSQAIPNLLVKAQEAEGIASPVRPSIRWPDGLPQDVMAAIEAEEAKLRMGITTPIRALMAVEDISEKEAQRIIGEREKQDQENAERDAEMIAKSRANGNSNRPPIQVSMGE